MAFFQVKGSTNNPEEKVLCGWVKGRNRSDCHAYYVIGPQWLSNDLCGTGNTQITRTDRCILIVNIHATRWAEGYARDHPDIVAALRKHGYVISDNAWRHQERLSTRSSRDGSMYVRRSKRKHRGAVQVVRSRDFGRGNFTWGGDGDKSDSDLSEKAKG